MQVFLFYYEWFGKRARRNIRFLYIHFKFKCKFSVVEFVHFGESGTAGVGADAVLLVVYNNYGAFAFAKLVDMLLVRKLLGSVVESGEFKSLAVEAHSAFAARKLKEICAVVVCTFLRLDHGHELIRYRGIIYSVISVREHIYIRG